MPGGATTTGDMAWGEDEDEEESASFDSKKRAAAEDVKEEQPPRASKRQCWPKLVLPDSSDSHEEYMEYKEVPEKDRMVKPPATRYELPHSLLHFYLFFTDRNGLCDITTHRAASLPSQPRRGPLGKPIWRRVVRCHTPRLLQLLERPGRRGPAGPLPF